jgi:two-component system cell cycle response regulator
MTLRARLAAALMLAAAVPVIVAVVVLGFTIPAVSHHKTDARVLAARATTTDALQASCALTSARARVLATAGTAAAAQDSAVEAAGAGAGFAAAILDSGGHTVAAAADAGTRASRLTALLPTVPDCATADTSTTTGTPGASAVAARVRTASGDTAVVAVAVDPSLTGGQGLLGQLQQVTGEGVTVVVSSLSSFSALGRTGAAQTQLPPPSTALHVHGLTVSVVGLADGSRILLSTKTPSDFGLVVVVVVVGLALLGLAYLLGRRLASSVTRPLEELSQAAERVTGGDLDFVLPTDGGGEPARLAEAFNTMTEALRRTITDLRTSRDELQRTVSRLGDTLSGTHDLDRILDVIVDTAMVAVRATGGALLLTAASGELVYLRAARGLDGRLPDDGRAELNRPVSTAGDGVVARVARTGEPVFGTVGADGVVTAADEPSARTILATPLRSGGKVTGVLALYDRGDGQPYDERDVRIVESFTGQAVAAVDNVLLHQEAQRLSITDGLTGLWNYRYAIVALAREVERASRFDRPLAVLMLDLDRFKRVNDRYGHQRGDAVLIEVAERVRTVVREVDILARYGGEELILIAPETDVAGAETLATKVRDVVRAHPVGAPGEEPVLMTTSVGVAVQPLHGDTARTLLRAADAALYEAKAAGRDRWQLASTAGPRAATEPAADDAAAPEPRPVG